MKPVMSHLNPYAAPFIPLSRQRTDNEIMAPITSENSEIDEATPQYKQVKEGETKATKITSGDSQLSSENEQQQLPNENENSEIDEATPQYKQVKEGETKATKITSGDSKLSSENEQHQLPNNATLKLGSSPDSRDSLGRDCNRNSSEDSMPNKTNDGTEEQSPIEDYELDLSYLAAAFPDISEQSLVDVYCANDCDLEASVDMLIQLEDDNFPCLPHTLNILDASESGTADEASGIQKTTGEASGSSHPSDSTSGSELP